MHKLSVRGDRDYLFNANFLFALRTSSVLLNVWIYVYIKVRNDLIKIPWIYEP